MSTAPARSALVITAETRPKLPRHMRLRHDPSRGRWVLLGPERVMVPDEIAVEVLQLCDGIVSVSDVVGVLAGKYAAEPEVIMQDVIAMLQDLAADGLLVDAREETGHG